MSVSSILTKLKIPVWVIKHLQLIIIKMHLTKVMMGNRPRIYVSSPSRFPLTSLILLEKSRAFGDCLEGVSARLAVSTVK